MRGHLKLIRGLRRAFLVGIFWAGKLAGKRGKSSETGGELVALPSQMLQGPVLTQKIRGLVPTL